MGRNQNMCGKSNICLLYTSHKGMLKVKNHPLKDVSQLTCVAKAMHGQVSVSDKLLKIFDAVSYTHLDVYKRQL